MAVFWSIVRRIYRQILKPIYRRFDAIEEFHKSIFLALAYQKQRSQTKKKNVMYTCISGNYDELRQHTYIDFDWDYICFTDDEGLLKIKEYGIWEIRPMEYKKLDNIKNSRWHKTHPHILFPDYEKSIWVDANINIKTEYLLTLIQNENNYKIRIPLHPDRDCIYQEIEVISKSNLDTRSAADAVYALLTHDGFPEHYGLNDTSIMYREHNNENIIEIMNGWWNMIEHYSRRDQLSLSYILWKKGISPKDIGIQSPRFDNENYQYYGHKKARTYL